MNEYFPNASTNNAPAMRKKKQFRANNINVFQIMCMQQTDVFCFGASQFQPIDRAL